ncbi:MAG: hypothetical protein M3Z04_02425, partial [Chloroflexota bacterium]|nr:hypothetical protein [Chloroflexota bacterium]
MAAGCRRAVPGHRYRGGPAIETHPFTRLTLLAAGVTDPYNQAALATAAALFGTTCVPLDPGDDPADLRRHYDLVLALETGPGATDLFSYHLPRSGSVALLVGNERRGLRPRLLAAADARLAIPMRGRGELSLNVAGAAAVALSQLHLATGTARVRRGQGRVPAVVLLAPRD